MDTNDKRFVKRASVIAVRGALAAMIMVPSAYAADAADAAGPAPAVTGSVEVGAGYVNTDSYKFGEYNGLEKKGAYAVGNIDLRGGGGGDNSAVRWRVLGTDLGLENRSLLVDYNNQGSFRVKYGYDELRRNYSDTFQTFYAGAGSSTLTIPAFAGIPAANRLTSTTTANNALANWQNIQSPYATAACAATGGVPTAACSGPGFLIPPAMQNFNVDTIRKKHNLEYTQQLVPGWSLAASVQHEEKDGTKLTGVAFGGPARGVLVPEPIDFTTDQFRASLGYVSPQSHFTIGYTGSIFKNGTNLWTVENPFNGTLLNAAFNNAARLIGAPDNEMHQLSLSGGYKFTPTTKLVLSGHYQRMTQNESFVSGLPSSWTLPESSANAKVINTNFNATLTSRPVKALLLTAVYKFEDRDNKTPSVNFMVLGGDAAGTPALFTNRPLNFRTNQFNIDGDYSLAPRQALKLGYEWKEVKRTVQQEPPPPAEAESPFKAEKTTENTVRVEYRNNFSPIATGRVSYAYSERRTSEYEESELLPVPAVAPFPAADPGLPEFRQFWLSERKRDRVRGVVNLQLTDALALRVGIEYNRDKYPETPFGLKEVRTGVFNLDGSVAASEALSFSAYYTYEDKRSQLDSLVIGRGSAVTILDAPAYTNPCTGYFAAAGHLPSDQGTDPCRQWSEVQSDRVHTVGVGVKAKGLVNERVSLGGDLLYSHARTPVGVSGGAYFGNGSTATAPTFNNIYIAAQPFPDITSEVIELRLNGTYDIDSTSAIRLQYIYRHLKSADWQYDAYTNSTLGVLAMPTFPGVGITSPNYNVHAFGVSYIYRFH